jgi:hypothetical protein
VSLGSRSMTAPPPAIKQRTCVGQPHRRRARTSRSRCGRRSPCRRHPEAEPPQVGRRRSTP